MHVAIITLHQIINSYGGTAKVFIDMANNLAMKGHSVTAIFYDPREGSPAFEVNNKVYLANCYTKNQKHISAIDKIKILLTPFKDQRKIKKIEADFKDKEANTIQIFKNTTPDVIISFQQEASYLLLEKLKIKIPIITTIHDDPEVYFNKTGFSFFKKSLEKCAFVQVLTQGFIDSAKKFLNSDNIIYIPNCVTQFEATSKLTNPVIINVGKLSNRKRQILLVKAFSLIHKQHKNWTLELWGYNQTSYASELIRLVKELKLEDTVKICGETKDIAKNLNRASIFAFPSRTEGFGLALGEAFSMGLPSIVCNDCAATSSLVRDGYNGLICSNTAEDLAAKITLLIENYDLRAALGKNAKEESKKFSPEKIWSQWDSTIRSIVKNNS